MASFDDAELKDALRNYRNALLSVDGPCEDLSALDDLTLLNLGARLQNVFEVVTGFATPLVFAIKSEAHQRLEKRRDLNEAGEPSRIEIAHPTIECVLEPQYDEYEYDIQLMLKALPLLKPDEREKFLVFVPPVTLDADILPGPIQSLNAIKRHHRNNPVGMILDQAISRTRKPDKFTFRPIPAAKPNKAAKKAARSESEASPSAHAA